MVEQLIFPTQPTVPNKPTRECPKQDIRQKVKAKPSVSFEQILKVEIDKQTKMCN